MTWLVFEFSSLDVTFQQELNDDIYICIYIYIYVCVCVCVCVCVFANSSTRAGCDTGSIFFLLNRLSNQGWKVYNLPITRGRIVEFKLFLWVQALCEMLTASFGIWTQVTVFISYDNNRFPSATSRYVYVYMRFKMTIKEIKRQVVYILSYLPTPPLGQDMTQGQFLSEVLQVWIQSFSSPWLVASPKLKNP